MPKENRYFEHFPTIKYGSYYMKNILTRVRFPEKVLRDYRNFYDYTLNDGDRLIHVAYDYYEDINFEWLVNIANEIVDPYYDTYLSEENLKEFVVKKYGSIVNAVEKILFYRNDWASDDTQISTAAFAAYTAGQKKYWDPYLGPNGNVAGYVRKKVDYIVNTNMTGYANFDVANNVIQMTPTDDYDTFSKEERITSDDDSSTYAFVTWANTSAIRFEHLFGDWSANTLSITGNTSGVTATINTTSVSITNIIPEAEQVYFSPVYAYDYEAEKNTDKKEIKLVEDIYAVELSELLAELV